MVLCFLSHLPEEAGEHHRNWHTGGGGGSCSPCGYVHHNMLFIAVDPDSTLPYFHDVDMGDDAGQAENTPAQGCSLNRREFLLASEDLDGNARKELVVLIKHRRKAETAEPLKRTRAQDSYTEGTGTSPVRARVRKELA